MEAKFGDNPNQFGDNVFVFLEKILLFFKEKWGEWGECKFANNVSKLSLFVGRFSVCYLILFLNYIAY